MNTFAALAEPNRRVILDAIREQPCTVNMLVEIVGVSQPGVSKHLRILREAGLVAVRPDGQRRWYELDPGALRDLDVWLEPYRRRWAQRLDALERHLDATDASQAQGSKGRTG